MFSSQIDTSESVGLLAAAGDQTELGAVDVESVLAWADVDIVVMTGTDTD